MSYCRLDGELVLEVTKENPEGRYHPSVLWYNCPDETSPGDFFNPVTGSLIPSNNPKTTYIATPHPVQYKKLITPMEFRNSFSAFEEVAINEYIAKDETIQSKVIGVLFDRLKSPNYNLVDLENKDNLAGLDLLVAVGLLTKERRDKIALGIPKKTEE